MNAIDVISQPDAQAAAQTQAAQATEGFQDALDAAAQEQEILPVEAYSLPDWYADLIPEQCVLTPGLDHACRDQTELENEAWRQEHQQELSEYFDLLNGYLREALDENGIEGAAAYYENVVLNPAGSEQVRQDFMDRFNENPRALELMETLEIAA